MTEHQTPKRYVVVALFDRMDVGAYFSRRDWPAHVTLASNFVTAASVDDLGNALQRTDTLSEPVTVEFGGTAWFGQEWDVPVRLVLPGRISELHRHVSDELQSLPGFAEDEPAYWRGGYRPHVTLTPTISAAEGERRSVCSIAIAQLERDGATVVAAFALE